MDTHHTPSPDSPADQSNPTSTVTARAILARARAAIASGRPSLTAAADDLARAIEARDDEAMRRCAETLRLALAVASPSEPDPVEAEAAEPIAPGTDGPARRRLRSWVATARKAVVADLAIHSMTYIGVLLAVVVIYVFYAEGYFGDVVQIPNLRPLVFIATPSIFFVLAWVLRTRTGIPKSAVAIELIGALFVPVMLSAAFRDGSTFPPDVNGPARWTVYGIVGLVSAGFYGYRARSRSLYRFLAVPVVWVAVGAFGLYVEPALAAADAGPSARDGISAFQLVLVVMAIAVTPVVAGRASAALRTAVVVPAMRVGALALPVIAFLMSAFARSDAVARGLPEPGLDDFGGVLALAFASVSVAFWSIRHASWIWDELGPRLRRDTPVVLAVLSHATGAAAVTLGAAAGIGTDWIGPVLVAWAGTLAITERSTPSLITRWTIAVAGLTGLALSLVDPWSTIAAWLPAAAAAGSLAAGRRPFGDAIVLPAGMIRPTLWISVFVLAGNGLGRAGWPAATPWLLAAAAAGLAGCRFRRSPWVQDLATAPAWILAGAAPASWMLELAISGTVSDGDLLVGAGVLAVAGVAVLLALGPWIARLVTSGMAFTGSTLLIAEVVTERAVDAAVLRSAWFAVVGLTLLGRSMARPQPRSALTHALLGHTAVLLAAAVAIPFERATLVGLTAVVAAHAAESWAESRDHSVIFEWLRTTATRVPTTTPALVAAIGIPVVAVLAGRQLPFLATNRAWTGLALAVAGWIALGLVRLVPTPMARRWYTGSALFGALAAIAVTVPSIPATAIAATSAAALLVVAAVVHDRPAFTVPAWPAAVAATMLWAHLLGLATQDRYLVLAACAAVMSAVPVAVMLRRGRPGGIRGGWLQPAFAEGFLLVPAALAYAMVDGRFTAELMTAAAVLYAVTGYATRAGAAAIPATAAAAMAYASFLEGIWSPYDSPIRLLPFAAAAVAATGLLSGRRSWRILMDPAPGVLLVGLAVAGLAVVTSETPQLAAAFGGMAAVLLITRAVRPERWWAIASSGAFLAATSLADSPWGALGAAGHALAFAVLATVTTDRPLGRVTAWYATGLAAVSVGEAVAWGSAGTAVTLTTLAIAAGITSAVGVALTSTAGLTEIRDRWTAPSVAAGSAGLILVMATAGERLEPATAADVIGLTLAWVAGCWAVVATARRLAWAATVSGGFAIAAAVVLTSSSDPAITVPTMLALGATLLIGGTVSRDRSSSLGAVWVPTLTFLGHGSLATAALTGFAAWSGSSDQFAAMAGALIVEAIAAAVLAQRRQDAGYAMTTMILAASAYAAGAAWFQPSPLSLAAATAGATAAAAGTGWVVDRLRHGLWVLPALGLAQIGTVAVAGLASYAGTPQGWGPVTVVLAVETLIAATVAIRTLRIEYSLLTAVSAAATVGAALARFEAPLTSLSVAGLAIGAIGAMTATHLQPRNRLWAPAAHLLATFGHTIAIAGAFGFDDSGRLLLLAAPLLVIAGHLGANADATPAGVPMRELSALSGSSAMLLTAVGIAEPAITVPLLGCIGLATTAVAAVRRTAAWTVPLGMVAVTAATAALLIPLSGTVPIDRGLVAGAVAFIGADLAVIGVIRRELLAVEAALATWLVAILLGLSAHVLADSHETIVPIAATMLTIIGIERKRRRDAGGILPDGMRIAEWALMVIPMVMAGADGISDLRYLGLLAAEGIALAGWGIVSEVRRRAFAGITGVFAAAAMFASIPVLEGTRGGLSGGTWLVIGAIAAVTLITLGSTLERYRTRIGTAMGRISTILEDWE
jgi:hypothetical protein